MVTERRDHSQQVRNALSLMRLYILDDGNEAAAEQTAADAKHQIDLYLLRLKEQRIMRNARNAGALPVIDDN